MKDETPQKKEIVDDFVNGPALVKSLQEEIRRAQI